MFLTKIDLTSCRIQLAPSIFVACFSHAFSNPQLIAESLKANQIFSRQISILFHWTVLHRPNIARALTIFVLLTHYRKTKMSARPTPSKFASVLFDQKVLNCYSSKMQTMQKASSDGTESVVLSLLSAVSAVDYILFTF